MPLTLFSFCLFACVSYCLKNFLTLLCLLRFTSLRSVPAYEKAVSESFERCLDLYLCPRARKKRVSVEEIMFLPMSFTFVGSCFRLKANSFASTCDNVTKIHPCSFRLILIPSL